MTSLLSEQLKKHSTTPFLFLGCGISRRYLGLENWVELLKKFCICGNEFEYYYSTCDRDLPTFASLLAKDFHDYWWKSSEYDIKRKLSKEHQISPESALKIEISDYIKKRSTQTINSESLREELNILRNACIDGIITTNWDTLIEEIFPDFHVYRGQEELLTSSPISIAEIYKIHGCCSIPNSLILTARDYNSYEEKNPYLASKLLTIFIEHPVIFMGYSLSDANIRKILSSIIFCLNTDQTKILQDRLIFIEYEDDKEKWEETKTSLQIDGTAIPITLIRTSDFNNIFRELANTKRKIPIRLLRKLKENIYDLILTNDPSNKLFVTNVDKINNNSDIEFVVGIGAIRDHINTKGYEGLSTADIIEDIIFDNKQFDSHLLLSVAIPRLLKHSSYIPIYKYLKNLNIDNLQKYKAAEYKLDKAIDLEFLHYQSTKSEKNRNTYRYRTIEQICKTKPEVDSLACISFIEPERIDTEQLHDTLAKHYHKHSSYNSLQKTTFKKLVCLYDRLKFGWDPIF